MYTILFQVMSSFWADARDLASVGVEEVPFDIGAMCKPVAREDSFNLFNSSFVLSSAPVLKTEDFTYLFSSTDDVLCDMDTITEPSMASDQFSFPDQDLTGWAHQDQDGSLMVPDASYDGSFPDDASYSDAGLFLFPTSDPYLFPSNESPNPCTFVPIRPEATGSETIPPVTHTVAQNDKDVGNFISVQPAATRRSSRRPVSPEVSEPSSPATSPAPSADDPDDEQNDDQAYGSALSCAAAMALFGRVPEEQLNELIKKMADHKPARGRRRCKQLAEMSAEEIEIERVMRMEKSRLSARECRQRKRGVVEELQKEIDGLERRDSQSQKVIRNLQEENKNLHQEVEALRSCIERLGVAEDERPPISLKIAVARHVAGHNTRHHGAGKGPNSPRQAHRVMRHT